VALLIRFALADQQAEAVGDLGEVRDLERHQLGAATPRCSWPAVVSWKGAGADTVIFGALKAIRRRGPHRDAQGQGEKRKMEDRNNPVARPCPHCENPTAELKPPQGDFSEYRCPDCGTYRVSGSMEKLVELGTVDPKAARIEERDGHRWLVQ
jgi:hypothetical protein